MEPSEVRRQCLFLKSYRPYCSCLKAFLVMEYVSYALYFQQTKTSNGLALIYIKQMQHIATLEALLFCLPRPNICNIEPGDFGSPSVRPRK